MVGCFTGSFQHDGTFIVWQVPASIERTVPADDEATVPFSQEGNAPSPVLPYHSRDHHDLLTPISIHIHGNQLVAVL